MIDLSIIVPIYNNEKSLEELNDKIFKSIKEININILELLKNNDLIFFSIK